jgi:ATP-dependent Clp protease ATP-binding subunit ClpX
MENILLDSMYDLPGSDDVEEIVINGDVVDAGAKPLLVHGERRDDVGSSA